MITEILSKVLPVLVMIALGRLCETKQIINDEQHRLLLQTIYTTCLFFAISLSIAKARSVC